MRISPHEQDRLLIRAAAQLADDRRARGRRLNHPEAIAVLSDWVIESARDGVAVARLMQEGRHVLTDEDVMSGVAALIREVQVEATFPDGTKLVTLHDPILPGAGADHGTDGSIVPGEVVGPDDPIELNAGRPVIELDVENVGDRPIQVGSHYHFPDVNSALRFDRDAAAGHRLDIPAGTAVRFEPGIRMRVALVPLAGTGTVPGLRRRDPA